MKTIIKNCLLIGEQALNNIIIENGKIVDITSDNLRTDNEIDANGLIATAGLIDMHTHLREPGFEYKEDIESATKAAVMGGFTAVAAMPNTKPVCDNKETIALILDKAKQSGYAKVFPIASITKEMNGKELTDFEELKNAGAVAVSDDGRPVESTLMMRNALLKAKELELTVISHCEDTTISEGAINEGEISKKLGIKGIPHIAEDLNIARECLLSLEYDVSVHIAHISTKTGVDLVRHYKGLGAKITAETCPHYFTLTEDAIILKGTNAKMNPPLRTSEDVNAVIEGLSDGTIDVIATDHAPHSKEEKDKSLEQAPNGIIGLETALQVGITYLVKQGHLTLEKLIDKMTVNPAHILKLGSGKLEIGADADITLFNADEMVTVDASKFLSKSKNTPFDGEKLYGKVKYVFINGKLVVENSKLI
jgi:dihydroorotase